MLGSCPLLTSVELRSCANIEAAAAISVLGSSCPGLTLLNLNRCDGSAGGAETQAGDMWRRHEAIGHLLRRPETHEIASSITPMMVSPLCACHSLSCVDVGWLTELVDDAAVSFMLCELAHLTVLSVEGCKLLTERAIWPLQPDALEAGGRSTYPSRLVRLNLSWVDNIRTEALHGALLGAQKCEDGAPREDGRSPRCADLQILDYYGSCWSMSAATGRPTRSALRDLRDGAARRALRSWVAAFDAGSNYFGVSDVTDS